MREDEAVDVLIVSAFPNDYGPAPGTLIESLSLKGVSVSDLARRKEVDLRKAFACWLSPEIVHAGPAIRFKRILCFEPLVRGNPPQVIGDIFRALAPFLAGSPRISRVAMPLVATGYQQSGVAEILVPLVEAAFNWMRAGMPLALLKIAARSDPHVEEARRVFAGLKKRLGTVGGTAATRPEYDVFVSYSREDAPAAEVAARHFSKNDLKPFIDKQTLEAGAAWQHRIFLALDRSRRVLALYSPSYMASKVCQEEFNIGWARARKLSQGVLFPVYWKSAPLPTYMEMLNYFDCREARTEKLVSACDELVRQLKGREAI